MAYVKDYRGVGEMLCLPGMVVAMRFRADLVAARARAIAPVESGDYASSFEVSSGIRPGKTRRAFGRVTNTSDHARFVEFGTENQPAHRTLRRALEAVR